MSSAAPDEGLTENLPRNALQVFMDQGMTDEHRNCAVQIQTKPYRRKADNNRTPRLQCSISRKHACLLQVLSWSMISLSINPHHD